MRCYLARWELDTDVAGDFWRAPASGVTGVVDLRPLADQGTLLAVGGYGFFAYPDTVDPASMTDQIDLGGDLNATMLNKAEVETALGVTLTSGTITDVCWEILTTQSDPSGLTGPKPLIPGTDLELELLLGGQSVIRSEPFNISTAPHRLQVIKVIQNDYRAMRTEALMHPPQDSRRETHLRMLSVFAEKYRTDYRTFIPDDLPDEGIREPGTNFGDSFNRANNTDLNASDTGKTKDGGAATWQWAEVAGNTQILSNSFRHVSLSAYARCDDDLSSIDHFCEGDTSIVTASGTEKQWGPCVRFASAANTSYMYMRAFSTPLSSGFIILRKTITGSRTNIGTSDTETAVAGEKIECRIDGSTLSGEHDDVELDSITDTAITGGTRGGIYITGSSTEVAVDDWFCEDIAVGGANPHNPLGHPLYGPFAGPVAA